MKKQNPMPPALSPAGNAFKGIPVHPSALRPFKMPGSILSISQDAKTAKGEGSGYLTGILYLAPGTLAGVGNLCPHASTGCAMACLFTAGRAGIFEAVNHARVMRSRLFSNDRETFLHILRREIEALIRKAKRDGMRPAVRLNGTSDLPWEKVDRDVFDAFPDVQFYDYTKNPRRAFAWAKGELPANYHLTFSLSESNAPVAALALAAGCNVAAVVHGHREGENLSLAGETFKTFNADRHDLRFLDRPARDGRGKVGILKAKGKAKGDKSGFVLRLEKGGA